MKKLFSHILMVEDDTITNFINETLLEDMQVSDEIFIAGSGEQALIFIQQQWLSSASLKALPKLLLLDINLVQMNGFELLEQLAMLPPVLNLCIVMLTTSQLEREKEKADKFKVDAFLEKPLTRQKLEGIASSLEKCAETESN